MALFLLARPTNVPFTVKVTAELFQCAASLFTSNVPTGPSQPSGVTVAVYCLILLLNLFALALENFAHAIVTRRIGDTDSDLERGGRLDQTVADSGLRVE